MQRISVVGNSGSGKTSLARQLAAITGVPLLELDSIFHLPGWTELPAGEFRARVGQFTAGDRWIVDGNYSTVRPLVWARADTVVWVDPPHPVVMARVVRRTLRRVVTREELWNGNREPLSNLFSWDRSIVAWSWTQRRKYRDRYSAAMTDPQWSHITFVPVRRGADRGRLLAAVSDGMGRSGRPGQPDQQVP